MSSDELADLVEMTVEIGGLDSVTVVRNGHLVLDVTIYPFPQDAGHQLYSVTKSVTATLIGIAIDQGLLAGVDVPVVEILADAAPAEVGEQKASMTIEHVLTMTTGLECRDSRTYDHRGVPQMTAGDDWAANVLALPMEAEPGTRFEYCNGASHLLSAIISEVTGSSAAEYATEVLFGPLGITDFVWPADPSGTTLGFSELALRPSDAAKIGYLYLRDGEWDGRQLVSASWVETATTDHIIDGYGTSYGYQWWVDDGGMRATARGTGGQSIHVVPSLDLVVVVTAGLGEYRELTVTRRLYGSVVMAIESEPPSPDPDGEARLAAAVTAAVDGPEPSPATIPAIAKTIDGVRWEFAADELPGGGFTLDFDDDSALLTLEGLGPEPDEWDFEIRGWTGLDGPVESEVGLTGRFVVDDFYGLPTAWRGQWTSADTFEVEFHLLDGTGVRGTFEFTFQDATAQMRVRLVEAAPITLTAQRGG